MNDTPCIGRRWFEEVWNQRKKETIYELLAPDSVAHSASSTQDLVGPEAWEQLQQEVLSRLPDMRVTIEDVLSTPENTVVRWSACGSPRQPDDESPTEEKIHFAGTTWFRIKDGKIVEGWDAWDQTGFVQALQRTGPAPAAFVP